ncbi:MAG: DUF2851 family protein [Akkermansia sp.]
MSGGRHPFASWAEAQAHYASVRACAGRTFAAAEGTSLPWSPGLLREAWLAGRLGSEGQTLHHGAVQVPDFGLPGAPGEPDVVHAELILGGHRVAGSVVFHTEAEDWERCGCGADARFDDVVLHVVAQEPPPGWFTRTSAEREVPVMPLCADLLRAAWSPPRRAAGAAQGAPGMLAELPLEALETLLQAAAAHRAALKRERFRSRVAVVGEAQAWYEAWAQTLGYGANAATMQMLARRVPLEDVRGAGEDEAVARLLGAAGFLVPVLPDRATEAERAYHRRVWDGWWRCRGCYAAWPLPWCLGAVRPMSHPHRRVAALACSAVLPGLWEQMADAAQQDALERRLAGVQHDFWDVHCSLSAPALHRRRHLVGDATLQAFRVNHLLLYHEGADSWGRFLAQRADAVPGLLRRTAAAWLGESRVRAGGDCAELLRRCYAQQGLLQLRADVDEFSSECL